MDRCDSESGVLVSMSPWDRRRSGGTRAEPLSPRIRAGRAPHRGARALPCDRNSDLFFSFSPTPRGTGSAQPGAASSPTFPLCRAGGLRSWGSRNLGEKGGKGGQGVRGAQRLPARPAEGADDPRSAETAPGVSLHPTTPPFPPEIIYVRPPSRRNKPGFSAEAENRTYGL